MPDVDSSLGLRSGLGVDDLGGAESGLSGEKRPVDVDSDCWGRDWWWSGWLEALRPWWWAQRPWWWWARDCRWAVEPWWWWARGPCWRPG
ncbi:MAG: hypothetical protein M3Y17_04060 [Actinomycetota bacterium]|nr:hypothetical protein [Actinomycetota bacterium]